MHDLQNNQLVSEKPENDLESQEIVVIYNWTALPKRLLPGASKKVYEGFLTILRNHFFWHLAPSYANEVKRLSIRGENFWACKK